MDGEIKFDDSIENLDTRASVFSKNDSVVISWSYEDNGKGIVIVGHKDPMGIFQRMIPVGAYTDKDGIDFLHKIGIENIGL